LSELPVFWSFRRCPYAMRARLAIAASGEKVELREIMLRFKPEAFRAVSAKATVPVLELGSGQVIDQSRDIMFWALQRNDPQNWLDIWYRDPNEVNSFIDRLDGSFKHNLDRYKYASRYNADQALTHRFAGAEFLFELDFQLKQESFLSGKDAGILDFASLPFVRQFRIADPDWFDQQHWPYLHKWLSAFLTSRTFAEVMIKYTPWQEGAEPVFFP
jgi:glutathione S-transferase